jgi:hypothetical protein
MAAELPPLEPGPYLLRATAKAAGRTIGADELAIEVVAQSREARWPGPDLPLLRAVAAATGGRVVEWRDLQRLEQVLPRGERQETVSRRQEVGRGLLAGLLLLALLTADWLLRRRWGLI